MADERFSFTWGMPIEGMGYARVFQFMLKTYSRLGVTKAEMMCLIHLASYHYESEGSEARPAQATIAEEMGYRDKARVSDLTRSLEEKDMLIIHREPGRPNVYDASPFASAAWAAWERGQKLAAYEEGYAEKRITTDAEKRIGGMRKSAYEEDEVKDEENKSAAGAALSLVVHDLDEVLYLMEGTGWKKDELTAQCPLCGAPHSQENNMCPDCQAPVIWLGSRVWKRLYGDPKVALRHARGEDLKPATPLEVEFCKAMNRRARFANITQQREFRRLARNYPAGHLQELIKWAADKNFSAFVSGVENENNLADYRRRHGIAEPQPEPEEAPSAWSVLDEFIDEMTR